MFLERYVLLAAWHGSEGEKRQSVLFPCPLPFDPPKLTLTDMIRVYNQRFRCLIDFDIGTRQRGFCIPTEMLYYYIELEVSTRGPFVHEPIFSYRID
jgi:hypothetical protein